MYSHAKELIKYLPAVSEFDVNVFEAILTIQSFQTDQIQISSRKIFTAHYACRNADFNFTLVMGTTKGFIFQNNQFINGILGPPNGRGEPSGLLLSPLPPSHSEHAFSPYGHIPYERGFARWLFSQSPLL